MLFDGFLFRCFCNLGASATETASERASLFFGVHHVAPGCDGHRGDDADEEAEAEPLVEYVDPQAAADVHLLGAPGLEQREDEEQATTGGKNLAPGVLRRQGRQLHVHDASDDDT